MFLLFFYIMIALVISFLCSVAEAVLLSVTPSFIAKLSKDGKKTAQLLNDLKKDVNRPLAAILTLNTIAHTIGAAQAGAQAAKVFGNNYVGVASAILTLLILVFSEIIPKTLGAVYWRQLAGVVARSLVVLNIVLYPFVIMAEFLTKYLSSGAPLNGFNRDEFAAMVDIGDQEGALATKESKVLRNIFRFRFAKVRDIMTPRTVLFALSQARTVGDVFGEIQDVSFSRIPIFDKTIDQITGFVLKSDIFLTHAKGEDNRILDEFRRDIKIIPGSLSLFELLELLLDTQQHITVVIDEFGGVEGIVTLEDVVETLLGFEIVDEADTTVDMQALARNLWKKRAKKVGLIKDGEELPPQ